MTHRRTIVEGDIKKFIDRELVPLRNSIPRWDNRPVFYGNLGLIIGNNRDMVQRQVEEQLEEDD